MAAVWVYFTDPYILLSWWNQSIYFECKKQDEECLNGITSFQNAWESSNPTIGKLNSLISLNHHEILTEVEEYLSTISIEDIKSFNYDLAIRSEDWIKNQEKWTPIWIRYMGHWTSSSNNIPSLKKIASLFPEIVNIFISNFQPGDAIINDKSLSRAVHRYHYGLKIPLPEKSLQISDFIIPWQEKEGFVWDNTIQHSSWNHTTQPRLIIVADVLRSFSPTKDFGTKVIYSVLQKYKIKDDLKTTLLASPSQSTSIPSNFTPSPKNFSSTSPST